MTGLPEYNFPAFNAAAMYLRELGYEVFNPAESFEGATSLPYATYLRHDIEAVLSVDAICCINGWEAGTGARLEVAIALALGLPIYFLDQTGEEPALSLVYDIDAGRDALTTHMATPTFLNETVLEEANRLIYGDRGAAYGTPLDDFTRTGKIWGAILGTKPVTAEQVALCMVGVKMSRECNASKRDNHVDIAGYAGCLAMVVADRARREKLNV
jgi:hypothetical protein